MKIKLTKKLKVSEKKEFIYRDKSYDWEDNYVKLIREYIEANWSYDKDNRKCLCDGKEVNDIVRDDILKMLNKSGLNICNQNTIRKAVTILCKENEFSKKQIAKEAKIEQQKQIPDILFKFINDKYGNNLSYNRSNHQVYWCDKIMTNDDVNHLTFEIKQEELFKSVTKSLMRTFINQVANLHQFEEKFIITDEEFDNDWDVLKNVNPDNWTEYLQKDSKNNLIHSAFNYACFLTFHPQFRGNLSFNSFDKIEFIRKYDKDYGRIVNKPIDDDIYALIKGQIEKFFGDYNIKHLDTALSIVLQNNSYHEIKQRFREIEEAGWDGTERMHSIMIKYFGCDDCPEIREMTEVMLCGSVQRILEENPDGGTMFDFMGIMFGKQGTGKTKFMTRLYFGDKFTSINPDINDDQKFTDLTNRAWLVLFDEMKSINKSDMGTVKSRITEQGANVRLSYGRRSKYYPRHCAFWGNTNYKGVLRDEGYERRFLCFECKNEIQHEAEWWKENYTDYDIDQIWAETLKIYHEKYEGKVIEICRKTQNWNYKIQIRHKVWVEDSRTDLELKEIVNYDGYTLPYYEPDKWRTWMKTLDELKTGNTSSHGKNELKIVNCKWVLSRIPRKEEWITGMMDMLGWKKIHVNDKIFGDEDYYIRGDLTFDEIIKDYDSFSYNDVDIENMFEPVEDTNNTSGLPF